MALGCQPRTTSKFSGDAWIGDSGVHWHCGVMFDISNMNGVMGRTG